MQIKAVNLILQETLRIFETVQDRIQRRIDEIVHIFGAHSGNFGLRRQLRRDYSDHVAPLLVQFDVFADRRARSKETLFRGSAKNAHRRGRGIFQGVEETALHDAQMSDLQVTWLHAVNDGSVLLRLGEQLSGSKPFAWRALVDVENILSNDLIIVERQEIGRAHV